MAKTYDLIIAGGGPAGITAAIYAARKKMDTLIVTRDVGGQAWWSGDIENYSGFQFITGPDLVQKFQEHINKYGIAVKEGEALLGVQKRGEDILVRTDKGEYFTRTVILATGKRSKLLDVPGEEEFRNKGVAYCATCDGPLFAGKKVAVVGGGNSALEAAWQLQGIAEHVYIINNTSSFNADPVLVDKLNTSAKVTVMHDSRVAGIKGEKLVASIAVKGKDGAQVTEIPVEGVFVEIGMVPNTGFESDIMKNDQGEVIVNCANETNVPGVFAAGDVTNVPEKQIIIAAGEGAKAALQAFRYIAVKR